MLKWAIIFFGISLIAGFFGFTNVAAGAKKIAKTLFFIALTIFLIVLVFGVMLGMLVFSRRVPYVMAWIPARFSWRGCRIGLSECHTR